MKIGRLLWKIPLALVGTVVGVALLLVVAVACVLYVPSLRAKAVDKGLAVAREKTGMDIDLGDIYLSPFHHSPMVLYRAYKGEEDLPLEVRIDSLYLGHRGEDTLLYARALRLKAVARLTDERVNGEGVNGEGVDILATPIEVEHLQLDEATLHSDTLLAAVGIDALIGHLELNSPELNIAEGRYPLHGLRLYDAYVGIGLRDTPPDTTAQDTTKTLMAFEVPDGEVRNLTFALSPTGMRVHTDTMALNVLADVGGSQYDVRRIHADGSSFTLGKLNLPFDALYGNVCVDLERQMITSGGLYARSDEMGAQANLSTTELNLETMQVDVVGDADFRGSKARLRAKYDIDDEAYDAHVDVEKVDVSPFLKDSPPVVIAGEIDAEGKGLDIGSQATRSHIKMHLTDAQYDNINVSGMRLEATLADRTVDGTLHLPITINDERLAINGQTEHQFTVAEFMSPEKMRVNYQTQMRNVRAKVAGEDYAAETLDMRFTTDSTTTLNLATQGLTADLQSPMHVMRLKDAVQPVLRVLDDSLNLFALIDSLPSVAMQLQVTPGHPLQRMVDSTRVDLRRLNLSLHSDSLQKKLSLDAAARFTDGVMSLHGLKTDADLRFDLERAGDELNGTGRLQMDDLVFGDMDLGSREVKMDVARSQVHKDALRADVQLDDIPMEIVDSILKMDDIALSGFVRAKASVDGLPNQRDISAEVLPLGVSALYKPYDVVLSLGETPIVMQHNKVDFNGLPIYGADSTFMALTGGLDLNDMRLDVTLEADSFAPTKLKEGGKFPIYGELATDIRGKVTGPLDSIMADVDVTLLPTTDITYPIDKKNLAQVKPHGTVKVHYDVSEKAMDLGGQLNVDDGVVRYSPKMYPIMPFHVDSGSTVTFNGPLGQAMLDVAASQQVKADVQTEGEETRRVDFRTGVRVNGALDSIGLKTIGFFLEAPEDETITRELASVDDETREGLAATLLATGMYVGESNVAAQRSGYALSSIVNSRLNAAMANSKMGKVVDIDLSSAQTEHAGGKTNDMNITISKSFFQDRFRITVGSTLTDNPDVNQTSGLLSNLSADYKLTQDGNVLLRAFTQRDYNNILEGELYKSGIGVQAKQDWKRQETYRGDSITRTYGLTADADVVYRSNNSIGPDLTLKSSIRNLMGHGETFTLKGNGAYYWALFNRVPGDPKKTDTYKFGLNASLIFPYLHWAGENKPAGDTRYMLGYQYENIAGGYGVHKVSGSLTYFIHSSKYVTHAFTPFSLSVVMMKAESDSLLNKAAEYPQLIKVIAGNEFVPAIGYNFIYNDYRSTRAVNTMFDLGIKEAGNIINGLYCLFGHKWDEQDKKLGSITFNQFVKLNAELRNKFNLTDKVCIATRLYAGANIPLGNSAAAPLSEAFYAGGPNSMRAASPYAYGPGNYYSDKYNHNFFHAGDVKLEANFELRFPIVWKIFGAAFVDAGNVWDWYNASELFKAAGITDYKEKLHLHDELYDGIVDNPNFAKQIALGTGAGLRLDLDGLVVRLDLGVAIHAPYQTYKYNKETWEPDYNQPINTYYNIPSVLDGLRLNFGIGYPF